MRWISCLERMPDDKVLCLLLIQRDTTKKKGRKGANGYRFSTPQVVLKRYFKHHKWPWNCQQGKIVTHWAPVLDPLDLLDDQMEKYIDTMPTYKRLYENEFF